MSILDKLIEVLCLAEGVDIETLNEDIFNEKITTKKALRAKRRKQRKLAKQKAAEQQKQTEQGDEGEQEEPQKSTALIVYDKNAGMEEEQKEHTEEFNTFNELYNNILNKYTPLWEKAYNIWKSAGEDKPCPQEAYDLLKQCVEGCSQEIQSLMNIEFPKYADAMHESELQYLECQITAMNGYLEKKGQLLETLHPEEYLDTENQDAIEGEVTPQLQSGDDLLALPDKSKEQKQDDGRIKKNIITYDVWARGEHKLQSIWNGMVNAAKTVAKLPFADFVKNAANGVLGWFEEGIWKIINSPLANDIVKAIMYCNPITAALFKGYIVNFGVKDGLDNLKRKRQEKAVQREKDKNDSTKQKYNKRGIPQNVDNLKWNQLKREFYGNKRFVDLVNVCFNHVEVANKDKADVQKYARRIDRKFKMKQKSQIAEIRKDFNSLLNTLNKICDYMEWDDENSILNGIKTWYSKGKGNQGNTKKDLQDIKTKKNTEQNSGQVDYDKLAQAILKAQGGEDSK